MGQKGTGVARNSGGKNYGGGRGNSGGKNYGRAGGPGSPGGCRKNIVQSITFMILLPVAIQVLRSMKWKEEK